MCKSYVSPIMILNLKFDAKMEPKSVKNGSKMNNMTSKCTQNGPKMAPRGLKGGKMSPKMEDTAFYKNTDFSFFPMKMTYWGLNMGQFWDPCDINDMT